MCAAVAGCAGTDAQAGTIRPVSTPAESTQASAEVTPAKVTPSAVAPARVTSAEVTTARATRATSGDGLHYVKIHEPFSKPGSCDPGGNTLEMTNCYLKKVVDTDQQIDVLQNQRFFYALTRKDRQAYLNDDAAWLKHRTAEVKKISTGGSTDAITQAQLTLKLSRERVVALS